MEKGTVRKSTFDHVFEICEGEPISKVNAVAPDGSQFSTVCFSSQT